MMLCMAYLLCTPCLHKIAEWETFDDIQDRVNVDTICLSGRGLVEHLLVCTTGKY